MTKLIQKMRLDLMAIANQKMEEFKGMGEDKSNDLIGNLIEANMSTDGTDQLDNVRVVESVVDDLMTVRSTKYILLWTIPLGRNQIRFIIVIIIRHQIFYSLLYTTMIRVQQYSGITITS